MKTKKKVTPFWSPRNDNMTIPDEWFQMMDIEEVGFLIYLIRKFEKGALRELHYEYLLRVVEEDCIRDLDNKELEAGKVPRFNDGWMELTIEEVRNDIGLESSRQRRILNSLSEKELVSYKRKGLPCKRWILINVEELQRQTQWTREAARKIT